MARNVGVKEKVTVRGVLYEVGMVYGLITWAENNGTKLCSFPGT